MTDASTVDQILRKQREGLDQREAVYRERMRLLYERQINTLMIDLLDVTRMIDEAEAAGIDVNPDWLRRQARFIRLIQQADQAYAQFADDGVGIVQQAKLDAIVRGQRDGNERMTDAGYDGGGGINGARYAFPGNINQPASERLSALLGDESPLRSVLASYGKAGSKAIEDALIDGMARGASPTRIFGEVRKKLEDITSWRLEALIRTEMLRGYRGALFDQYAQGGVAMWSWSAFHGPRTCLACLIMSGQEFPMTDPFMAAHVNCRCSPSPVPIRRLAAKPLTGKQYISTLSDEEQRALFPSVRVYNAWKRGDVGLDDVVGMRDDAVWGKSVRIRSAQEILGK